MAADQMVIRDARNGDEGGLIALIGGCFAEYPGCVLDVDGEIPELRAVASHYQDRGGRFWVAEIAGRVVGCVGAAPIAARLGRAAGMELLKLYVDREARGCGLGGRLVGLVDEEAALRQAEFVELWTDTRFEDAHRLYERLGFRRLPELRDLCDRSNSVEYHYIKHLTGT